MITHVLHSHLLLLLLLGLPLDGGAVAGSVEVKVGVVLDMASKFGKSSLTTINMALKDFYTDHRSFATRLAIHVRDSKGTTVAAASAAVHLLKDVGVDAIIGTQSSSQAVFVSDLAGGAQVPLVSFSATSPSLSSGSNSFFVRTTLNDSAQVPAIASLFRSFAWREVVLVYEDTEFGSGIVPDLTDALLEVGAVVAHRALLRRSAGDVEVETQLTSLMGMRTRVFVVHAGPTLGSILFREAARLGMMGADYVWIVTTGITMELDSIDPVVLGRGWMNGVLGLRPIVPEGKVLDEFSLRWKRRFAAENPANGTQNLTVFDLWAYDTVYTLALATEKVGDPSLFRQRERGGTGVLDLGVSRAGPKLLSSILKSDFQGISGRFRFTDGKLDTVGFELINFVGSSFKRVGYWTPSNGLSKYQNSYSNVTGILWPGGLRDPPRGWEWPVRGKKLRIGVPVSDGSLGFANISYKPREGRYVVSGFCIQVFEAAMAKLGYKVPFEYTSLSGGTYDDHVQQVYINKVDAAVGDITIWYNRSTYVDFTTPFTESGVVMIVAVEGKGPKFWSFLEPMTYQLWVATLAAFLITAFMLWLLEHENNPEFQVENPHDLGRLLFFSFSTMVVIHRGELKNNLSRVVMIVWVLVLFVLISSYTANMSSILTSQELQPSFMDAKDLIDKGEKVGYLKNSFVKSLLISLGFEKKNLVPMKSTVDYAEALSKGGPNGGVSAVFDEIPYVRLFLSKHSDKYKVVGQTYKTDGFGFVFPRGSPLVADISHAILKLKEDNEMLELEKQLYGDLANAPLGEFGDSSSDANRLSLNRFMGLFLITGITSLTALLLHLVSFGYQNRGELARAFYQDRPIIWVRIFAVTRLLIVGLERPRPRPRPPPAAALPPPQPAPTAAATGN